MPGVRLDNPSLYAKDMYKVAYEVRDAAEVMYNRIYKVVPGVTGAGDKNTQILGLGDLDRHTVEGQDINFRSPQEGWSYYVKYWTFSGGLSLTFEAVQDTVKLGNFLKDLSGTWTEAAIHTKEEFAARPFNQGGALSGDWIFNGSWTGHTDPSGDLLYDSKPLFNLTGNSRSSKGGDTYYTSVAGLTMTPANFETIYNLHTATNNRTELDRPMKNSADTLLTYPGADALMAKRICKTERGLPGGELNDLNPYYGLCEPMSWDYLTDINTNGGFYVGKRQHKDFQFHERQRPLIDFFEDKNNKGYKASYIERYGILLKTFKAWTRGGGSAS